MVCIKFIQYLRLEICIRPWFNYEWPYTIVSSCVLRELACTPRCSFPNPTQKFWTRTRICPLFRTRCWKGSIRGLELIPELLRQCWCVFGFGPFQVRWSLRPPFISQAWWIHYAAFYSQSALTSPHLGILTNALALDAMHGRATSTIKIDAFGSMVCMSTATDGSHEVSSSCSERFLDIHAWQAIL